MDSRIALSLLFMRAKQETSDLFECRPESKWIARLARSQSIMRVVWEYLPNFYAYGEDRYHATGRVVTIFDTNAVMAGATQSSLRKIGNELANDLANSAAFRIVLLSGALSNGRWIEEQLNSPYGMYDEQWHLFMRASVDVFDRSPDLWELVIQREHSRLVRLLITYGANPYGKKGEPLLYAVQEKSDSSAVVLLETGAYRPGEVLNKALRIAVREADVGIAELLLQKGGVFTNINDLLIEVCKKDYTGIANLLLKYGADPDANGGEPLRIACRNGYYALAHYLIDYKAHIPLRDDGTLAIECDERFVNLRCLLRDAAKRQLAEIWCESEFS